MAERALYSPIKAFLEAQGFAVKGEVGAADVVGRRGEELVIVELKQGFSLTLFHQGIARQAMTDQVYLAVPRPKQRKALRSNIGLARRLGLGVLCVDARGRVSVEAEPGPFRPRKSAAKRKRLVAAFDRLRGDPNEGGATRHGLVTGYRQDAVACARYLAEVGPSAAKDVAAATGVPGARAVMYGNPYGWFCRSGRGVYDVTEVGRQGLLDWGDV